MVCCGADVKIRIADAMLEVYEQEFNKKGLNVLQAKADRLENEINLALDMSLKALNMEGPMRFMNRMVELEAQKNDVLIDISKRGMLMQRLLERRCSDGRRWRRSISRNEGSPYKDF